MAIHDDNWTKEMPNYYPQSTGDRIVAGGIALAILLVAIGTIAPSLVAFIAPLLITIGVIAGAAAFVYFTYIAVMGRLPKF